MESEVKYGGGVERKQGSASFLEISRVPSTVSAAAIGKGASRFLFNYFSLGFVIINLCMDQQMTDLETSELDSLQQEIKD
eukprot:scaffold224_cov276-Chaetoceros_neogracile.AAC.9